MASADLILSVIQSALKLGVQARRAYVGSTYSSLLALKLLNYESNPKVLDAVEYFMGNGKEHVSKSSVLMGLQETFEETDTILDIVEALSDEQRQELVTLHNEFVMMDMMAQGFDFGQSLNDHVSNDALSYLLQIRQWRKGNDPSPTVLKRFAASFVEIGVDYFVHYPDALNKDLKNRKLLHAFFTGLDGIPFSEHFSEDRIGDLPERLMMTTLEKVAEQSEVLSGDPKYQQLIAVASRALMQDVAARIEAIRQETGGFGDEDTEGRAKDWAEMVFQSLLGNGGLFVISNPKQFFGLDDVAQAELISHVGQAVLGFVLDQPQG